MEFKVRKLTVVEEDNELGNKWIERLVEKQILHLLNLPMEQQALLTNTQLKEKDEFNEMDETREET
ncbi:hypothetical protein [Alteribacter natronophilus]|uniref:hypothetical protein n=1 Tax=Alteribacter natronophilus TaxID=2583810 RepID=UPI00110F0047|nr:hypothetical protein [Alteribacter natronophilus]TMW71167.1 hypothetical protein FGB90_14490 [Alteribacter natronophilus]